MPMYRGYQICPCNCGGPQRGTDHSPDCDMVLDAMDVDYHINKRIYDDQEWEIANDQVIYDQEMESIDHSYEDYTSIDAEGLDF